MIETNRLTLRPYLLNDYQPYLAMCTDAVVVRFLGGRPFSPEDAWHRLMRYAGHWSLLGHGIFAVFEKCGGNYVGETGIADFHRGLGASFDGVGEGSWTFSSRVHGFGYAFEATEAAHRWYTDTLRQSRTVCLIRPENSASLKLASRLDYTAFGEQNYKDQPMIMLERQARL